MKYNYICTECGRQFDINSKLMVCPDCSSMQKADEPVRGILEVQLDGHMDQQFSVFDLLPIEKEYFPSVPVGNTPLWEPANIRDKTGFDHLYIKDDGVNPTFSFKDRASFLVSAFAKKHGINEIVLASTGNAGSSMAGIGAAALRDRTLPSSSRKRRPKPKLFRHSNTELMSTKSKELMTKPTTCRWSIPESKGG